jgi:hypothetical protein
MPEWRSSSTGHKLATNLRVRGKWLAEIVGCARILKAIGCV